VTVVLAFALGLLLGAVIVMITLAYRARRAAEQVAGPEPIYERLVLDWSADGNKTP
jgi:ABC-type nickel/cobalt efflux system permease component RcnA